MIENTLGNFINGQWQKGEGAELSALNPATDDVYWQGFESAGNKINDAVGSARKAYNFWSGLSLEKRFEACETFSLKLKENAEKMADVISTETGKPFWEAKTEVTAAANKLKISMDAYNERTGEKHVDLGAFQSSLNHRALGVVAILGPYNFPLHLPNGHIIPALLAGNTVVYKPSEQTPLTAIEMVKLWQEAGLPEGVLNLVQGRGEIGQQLVNQTIDGVFFTGSADTGIKIHKQLAGRPNVLLALEMGGNNPLVVWDIDNIEAAVYNTIQSAFITSGQRCTCARRLLLQKGRNGDLFLETLVNRVNSIKVGSPSIRPEPFMGPIINKETSEFLLRFQEACHKLGGSSLLSMKTIGEQGAFLSPGLVEMTGLSLNDEEAFGPLLQIQRFDDFEEAITAANKTKFGLAAGLLSDNSSLYIDFKTRVRAGLINFNRPLTGAASSSPFGGVGLSGNYRPSAYYAADFSAYPVASLESETLTLPESKSPGLNW